MIAEIEVKDSRAAAVFSNLRQREIVLMLIEHQCSQSQLAKAVGMSLSLLHYHLKRFTELGLVEVAVRRPRAGAPIKLYRATAKAFFVPAALNGDPSGPLTRKMHAALERAMLASYKGVVFSHDGSGAKMQLVRDRPGGADAAEFWIEMPLRRSDATSLVSEFKALIERYRLRSAGAHLNFVIHVAIAAR